MPHYKDNINNIYWFEEGTTIPVGLIELTEIEVLTILAAIPPEVPHQISKRQAWMQHYIDGTLTTIETYFAGIVGVEGDLARIQMETAATIDRSSPFVALTASLLAYDEARTDQFFIDAAKL